MLSDDALLSACPDFLSFGDMLKATPHTEGARRLLYFEASNEGRDQQGEIIAASALAAQADYYKRYGNLDIDHYTQVGARLGIPNYNLYEVGRPLEVNQRGRSTFVKAEVYSGEGPAAERANDLWATMTQIKPPQRWYPSVGGKVQERVVEIGRGGVRKVIVKKVLWTNVGLSKTPVNQHVGVATIPMEVLAKSWGAGGLDIDLAKTLTAGYGTDSASLTGGAALRKQSLYGAAQDEGPIEYFDFRERTAAAIRAGKLGKPSAENIQVFAIKEFGLSPDEAAGNVERFMRDLHQGLKRSKLS